MQTSDYILIPAVILYGLLFIIETKHGLIPLIHYLESNLTAKTFNQQKKLSIKVRIAQATLLPIFGFIVDSRLPSNSLYFVVAILILTSLVSLLIARIAIGGSLGSIQWKRDQAFFWFSVLYAFQYIGGPLLILVASNFYDYRATIIQFTTLTNFAGTVVQVYIIDQKISEALDSKTTDGESIASAVINGRIAGKFLLLVCYVGWLTF